MSRERFSWIFSSENLSRLGIENFSRLGKICREKNRLENFDQKKFTRDANKVKILTRSGRRSTHPRCTAQEKILTRKI